MATSFARGPLLSFKMRMLFLLVAAFIAILTYFLLPFPETARLTAAIFVFGALLWMLTVFPPFATALLLVLLLTFTFTDPTEPASFKTYLVPFSSPLILLFLGGFILGRALEKHGVSSFIARLIIARAGTRPAFVMLSVMIACALLSMWITDTATTVIMLGLTSPFVSQIPSDDPMRKGLTLAVPISACIGGIGTPIGTPPNVIALGGLQDIGVQVSFGEWMAIGIPLSCVLLILAYFLLLKIYPCHQTNLRFEVGDKERLSGKGYLVLGIFCAMVFLWVTGVWHGLHASLVAMLGACALILTGLIERKDINSLDWDVLILMWGALGLGIGMRASGLVEQLVALPPFEAHGLSLLICFALLAYLLSSFMSHTAATSLIIPLALAIEGENPVYLAITIALTSSLAFVFPVSTPPTALAYATGRVRTWDIARAGLPISLVGIAVLLAGGYYLIRAIL